MILVVGECLVDVVEHPDGSRSEHAGGSPANVAVGLGRLGLDVTLATALGEDDHGALVAEHLADSGVRLALGSRGPRRTSTALARLDERGAATYEFDVTWDAPPLRDIRADAVDVVHTGSIAATLLPGAADVEQLVERLAPSTIVSFDPNVRPDLVPDRADAVDRVERLVALSDIVKVSDEDLAWLHPDHSPDAVAARWSDAGASLVVVTRGASGATAHTAGDRLAVPVVATATVDTVGAGDAFMSGLLAGLHRERLLHVEARAALRVVEPEVLTRVTTTAARSAALTVSRAGAQPPRHDEL